MAPRNLATRTPGGLGGRMSRPADPGVFVKVACPSCGRDDVFLKCDQCGRQSLFSLGAELVTCRCGAEYGHAVCACGERVPAPQLVAVPFEEGPLVPGEVEIDPARVVLLGFLAVGFLVALAGGAWLILG